jgi:hypothetical protein
MSRATETSDMKMTKASAGVVLLAGFLSAGCQTDSSTRTTKTSRSAMTSPATQPSSSITTTTTKAPAPRPTPPSPTPPAAATAATPVPEKDLTHVVSEDSPYYASSPAQGRPADGTLKAGTKVLVMMPRGSYSQVVTADGKRVYTTTSGLKPIGS